jgi:hypothetical protein
VFFVLACAVLSVAVAQASAATYTWTGAGTAGVWTDPSHWTTSPATGEYPADSADTAIINTTTQDITVSGTSDLNEIQTGAAAMAGR